MGHPRDVNNTGALEKEPRLTKAPLPLPWATCFFLAPYRLP